MISWSNLYVVALVSVFSTVALVSVCAYGIRFLTNARYWRPAARKGKLKAKRKVVAFLGAAYFCFALCFCGLLFGIYLVVPYFR